MNAWDDPRVRRGMEKPIGWKVGFGAPLCTENLIRIGEQLRPSQVVAEVDARHGGATESEVPTSMPLSSPHELLF